MKHHVKIDYILVCEDIRQEVGKKPSAMGIFTDDILVRDFPYHFPKLCFLVHGFVLGRAESVKLAATFQYTDMAPLLLVKDQELKVGGARGGFVLNLFILPLVLQKAGKAELVLDFDSKRYRRKFSVRKANDPSVFSR